MPGRRKYEIIDSIAHRDGIFLLGLRAVGKDFNFGNLEKRLRSESLAWIEILICVTDATQGSLKPNRPSEGT